MFEWFISVILIELTIFDCILIELASFYWIFIDLTIYLLIFYLVMICFININWFFLIKKKV